MLNEISPENSRSKILNQYRIASGLRLLSSASTKSAFHFAPNLPQTNSSKPIALRFLQNFPRPRPSITQSSVSSLHRVECQRLRETHISVVAQIGFAQRAVVVAVQLAEQTPQHKGALETEPAISLRLICSKKHKTGSASLCSFCSATKKSCRERSLAFISTREMRPFPAGSI